MKLPITNQKSSLKKDGTSLIKLARPTLNVTDRPVYNQPHRIFKKISNDSKVKVVDITGQRHAFCTVNDLNEFVDLPFETASGYCTHALLFFCEPDYTLTAPLRKKPGMGENARNMLKQLRKSDKLNSVP